MIKLVNIIYSDKIYGLLSLIVLIIFGIYKSTHLNVSYFWDESWVYAPAVAKMADHGASLLPGVLEVEYSRGHPLLFHFLGGLWASVFGKSHVALHGFALTVSITLLATIWYQIKHYINAQLAFMFILFVCIQQMFVAQSSMVLPEVMLAGFSLLAILLYLRQSYIWMAIVCALALMTKESGLVCYASINLLAFIDLLRSKIRFKNWLWVASPIFIFIGFFLYQHSVYGWYFFPEHTGMIDFTIEKLQKNFASALKIIFLEQNKQYFFIPIVLLVIYHLWKKASLVHLETGKKLIVHLTVFLLLYLFFSIGNFLSSRYLLVTIMTTLLSGLLLMMHQDKNHLSNKLLLLLSLPFLWIINERKSYRDINLSYLNYAPVQSEMVSFVEDLNIYDESLYCYSLVYAALNEPYAGYRTNERKFTKLNQFDSIPDQHYFLIESLESWMKKKEFIDTPTAKLIKRVEGNDLWFELYYIDESLEQLD